MSKSETTFAVLRKTGRSANGYERDRGHIYHAVPPRNGHKALCGTAPGARADWSEWPGEAVTCPRCLSRLAGGAA